MGNIVPAPVPFPPVPITITTECPLKTASTSLLDSSSACAATSGLCLAPSRPVVRAPMSSRSSLRHVGQREFVGIKETRAHRALESFRVLRVDLVSDAEITTEQRLH